MQENQSRPQIGHKPPSHCRPAASCIPEEPKIYAITSSSRQAHDSTPSPDDSACSYDRSKPAISNQPPLLLVQPCQSWAPPQRSNAAQTSPFATAPPHIGPRGQMLSLCSGQNSHGSNSGQGCATCIHSGNEGRNDLTNASPVREDSGRVQLGPTMPPHMHEVHEGMLRTRPDPQSSIQEMESAALAAFDRPNPGKSCNQRPPSPHTPPPPSGPPLLPTTSYGYVLGQRCLQAQALPSQANQAGSAENEILTLRRLKFMHMARARQPTMYIPRL